MKVLAYIETPTVETGAGQLSKKLMKFVHEFGYEIEIIGINKFAGDPYNHELYPYKIHDCPDNEAYNRVLARDLILTADYDLLMLVADVGNINSIADAIQTARVSKQFPVLMYSCVDCNIVNIQTISCLMMADFPVLYSQHSQNILKKFLPRLEARVVPHGYEPDVFFPLEPEQKLAARKQFFKIESDKFLALSVNRNQWRKDLGRTLMIFHEFHKEHPKSTLYMHSKMQDVGGSLPTMAAMLGMRLCNPDAEVMFADGSFHERGGISRENLNIMYNCADCLISTSTGEGWGFSTTEAMAAGCPVVGPRNSSFIEILGENEERGFLADSGGDIDHLIFPYGITDNPREIVHSQSMIEKIEAIYLGFGKEKVMTARKWAEQNSWDSVRGQWHKIFQEIENEHSTTP